MILSSASKCTLNMYADNTSVACSAKDIDDLSNDPKAEVADNAEWLQQNKLSLNTDKTEYMIFGQI